MVYREAADPRRAEEESEPTGPLLVVDARGRRGKHGRDGAPGADGNRVGADGDRGGDAGEAGDGQPGGRAVVELTADPADRTTALVSGTVERGDGSVSVSERVEFSRAAPIELLATGGAGGNGGNGGDGGTGARGSPGADATRYSSGGNGGRGGDGGDGGRGTNGGDGGDGGAVVVRTSERDTHLLMLVRPDVRGAPGGAAGRNGHGGAAGPGGSGGSSHSWTESESYTDSSGALQTRTTHHRNSGGSDGPRGRAGDSPTTRLRAGSVGASGEFRNEVRDDSGAVARYPSCFDLRLVSYVHRNENDDGVYEPGERVFVGKIEIENVGGMPLPAHHDVIVGITRGGWVEPERGADGRTTTLRAPRGLAAGARHVFASEELALRLGTFAPTGAGGPLSAPETIRLYAALPDVVRSFDAFDAGAGEAQGKIVVRFPVALSPITSLHSVAAGQATRLRASLENVASKDFGADSALGRALTLRVALAPSELSAEQVLYFDAEGNRASLASGFVRPIERIAAGTRFELEGTVAIADDAPPYATARIVVTCDLAPVEVSGPPRTIQIEEFTLRVGRAFAGGTADVLFMVNNRTRAEELRAWEAHAASLGLTSATWDVALEDGVEILDAIARGEHAFRAVVLLNNMMDTAGGERRPARSSPRRRPLPWPGVAFDCCASARGRSSATSWCLPRRVAAKQCPPMPRRLLAWRPSSSSRSAPARSRWPWRPGASSFRRNRSASTSRGLPASSRASSVDAFPAGATWWCRVSRWAKRDPRRWGATSPREPSRCAARSTPASVPCARSTWTKLRCTPKTSCASSACSSRSSAP